MQNISSAPIAGAADFRGNARFAATEEPSAGDAATFSALLASRTQPAGGTASLGGSVVKALTDVGLASNQRWREVLAPLPQNPVDVPLDMLRRQASLASLAMTTDYVAKVSSQIKNAVDQIARTS